MLTAKRVIKNTGFLYAKMGVTMFISLYTTRLVLNSLGSTDFGIFNIVGGAISMLSFLNAAMASATQRFMSFSEGEGDKEKQKKIFNISYFLHIIIGVIFGVILILIGLILFDKILNIPTEREYAAKIIYGCLILSTVFTVMTVPYDAVLNARENMFYYSIVGIFESLLKLIIALIITNYIGDKLIIYGILMCFVPIISMITLRIYCHKNYEECRISAMKYWDNILMKNMIKFALWNLYGTASSMIMNYGRLIIANVYFGATINATMGIVAQINGQILSLSSNMMKAVNPAIVKAEGAGNRENMFEISFTASKISFFIYSFFAIPLFLETKLILSIWLKEPPKYTEVFIKIYICQVLIEQLATPLITILSATGQIKKYNYLIILINTIVIFVTILIFNLNFEPYTMMIVSCFSAVCIMFMNIYFTKKYSELPVLYFMKEIIFKSFISFVIVLGICNVVSSTLEQSLLKLVIILIVSILLLILLLYSYVLSQKERIIIKAIIDKILNYKNKFLWG